MEATINSTVEVEQSDMDQNNVSQHRCELNCKSEIGFRGCFEFRNLFIPRLRYVSPPKLDQHRQGRDLPVACLQ